MTMFNICLLGAAVAYDVLTRTSKSEIIDRAIFDQLRAGSTAGCTASGLEKTSHPTTCQMTEGKLTIHYGFSSTTLTLCIQNDSKGWIGFGVPPQNADQMINSHVLISTSTTENDKKFYKLSSKEANPTGVVNDVAQNIAVEEVNGKRMMCFQLEKTHLKLGNDEDLTAAKFIYAHGEGDSKSALAHHDSRGFISLDLTSKAGATTTTTTTTTTTSTKKTTTTTKSGSATTPAGAALLAMSVFHMY